MVEDNIKQHFLCNFGVRIKKKGQSNSLHLSSKHYKKISQIRDYVSLCQLLYKEMTV